MNPFLDFSQYKQFTYCELSWFERYVAQQAKARLARQADDPMTLGSLVHAALEQYRLHGAVGHIPDEVVTQYTPTPECLAWAQTLARGYCNTYPDEEFTRYRCEEPVRFGLIDGYDGLAKLDSYFLLNEQRTIAGGLGDGIFTMEPGYWVHEYKTKDVDKDRGNYMDWWRVCMQADFQMHALHCLVGEYPKGIFINVIEKPKPYKPRHTCKACKASSERTFWIPTGPEYACPLCNNVQPLDIVDRSKGPRIPTYYRLKVERTPEQLNTSFEEMKDIAGRMSDIRHDHTAGLSVELRRTTENCVNSMWGPCEYFEPHVVQRGATGFQNFVSIDAFGYITK